MCFLKYILMRHSSKSHSNYNFEELVNIKDILMYLQSLCYTEISVTCFGDKLMGTVNATMVHCLCSLLRETLNFNEKILKARM